MEEEEIVRPDLECGVAVKKLLLRLSPLKALLILPALRYYFPWPMLAPTALLRTSWCGGVHTQVPGLTTSAH